MLVIPTMPDFRGSVYSFPIEVFRILAPKLEAWHIQQASLPFRRLWWNSNSGASATWHGEQIPLGPDNFVLVAPETRFEVTLRQPIKRHLFIHFNLGALSWRVTDHVYAIRTSAETKVLAQTLVRRIPPSPEITIAEPMLGISLVSAVLSKVDTSQWPSAPADARVCRVVAAIDSDPGFAWSDETLARLATMSVGGFVRLFHRQMGGISPQAYLSCQRLAMARRLLIQTDFSIETIAERCGFCDRSYFSTVFRREVGIPPAKYRSQTM